MESYGKIILASSSPRRRMLMSCLYPDYECIPADIDETPLPGELPVPYTERMALEKMLKSAESITAPDHVVIGSDTTVYAEHQIFGKPTSPENASEILHFLNGKEHLVSTAVCVMRVKDGIRQIRRTVSETSVFFRNMSDEEIAGFVASGVPMGKAGAYAIQDKTYHPVERIEGCYAGVIGFPVCHLRALLNDLGLPESGNTREICDGVTESRCAFFPQVRIENINENEIRK